MIDGAYEETELVTSLRYQLTLQAQLLEARELIDLQAEVMEDQAHRWHNSRSRTTWATASGGGSGGHARYLGGVQGGASRCCKRGGARRYFGAGAYREGLRVRSRRECENAIASAAESRVSNNDSTPREVSGRFMRHHFGKGVAET